LLDAFDQRRWTAGATVNWTEASGTPLIRAIWLT
jgi:hypothetical protein